ncbi:alpha/beta hydrolase family domain-containing protein [Hirsutella rhossiliensis]|uniref:Alpha/beta hydrolase family domain-containing protein n=1 Tax=Hirsutella rhossiliensis TaxID=111463 RepID=A0A9P8MQK6_9HYPO|nr:alpha/beta hydrolase family domain-containing protein [Hirsutella rhossiliensis]KAH0957417.1 alpha/beta hydrolase family domain-containing protein [Hirsutella rhossiliensis]
MTHGFNCVKEMLLPEIAERFQSSGYNALIYDPRSIGDSDGLPRNYINPLQQAEDLSDVLTHVATFPSVDANRIVLWGMSFGATVSACSAAVDRRARAVVMVCPIFSFVQPSKRERAFAQLIRDRESQLRGNEAVSLPPFNSRGENPIGMAGSGGPGGLEAYEFMRAVVDRGAPGFRDRVTLQTYRNLAVFRPVELLDMVRAPVMMVVPELDDISPAQEQEEAFERFGKQQPKTTLYRAAGKGHLTVLSGEGSEEILDAQVDFIKEALEE